MAPSFVNAGEPQTVRMRRSPESDGDDVDDGDNGFTSTRSKGGRRINAFKDDEDEDAFESAGETQERGQSSHKKSRTDGLPSAEFQPGAIVRVRVKNFVTYEEAEFHLGPHLNMIIGPNGTGKSSLVCAICLGLGYPTSVLGRASAFSDFVKHGNDQAEIEVELQRKPEEDENYIIGLLIRREDNSRKFTLNGGQKPLKQIQQLVKSLRIQIDNLCQFLPQDKVAEFAALTPIELLEKTLNAAAPPEMIAWQNDLKQHFKDQKQASRKVRESQEQLRALEARQQILQTDVEKLRDREAIQATIAELDKLRLLVEYNQVRSQYTEAKSRKKEGERNLKRLQDSFAPSLEAVNRKQEYQARVQAVVEERKRVLVGAETAADEALAEIDVADSKIREAVANLEAANTQFTAKKQELLKIRQHITNMEANHRRGPRDFDAADYNRRIREQEHLHREKTTEHRQLLEELRGTRALGNEKKNEMRKMMDDFREQESQQGQLLNQLRRANPDVAKGWEWLKDNQEGFEKEVFGPPMLVCSLKDSRYVDVVQSMLAQDDFFCFTTQTKEDHKKLSDQFYGKMGLSVTIRSCFTAFDSFRPPLPRQELAGLGLDGYAIEYLTGPEPVLAMLCAEKRLHASAVALAELSEAQFQRIQQRESISHYAAGKQLYRTTRRREYGAGAVSTRVTQFPKGRFWTDQPLDSSEQDELKRKLNAAKGEYEELQQQYRDKTSRSNEVEKECEDLANQIKELRKEKNALQLEYTKWQALPDLIETEKRRLAQRTEEVDEIKDQLTELGNIHGEALLEKVKAVLRHREKLPVIRAACQDSIEAEVLLIEAVSDVETLKEENAQITLQLEQEKRVLQELTDKMVQLHRTAAEARDEVQAILDSGDREQLLSLAKDKSSEEIAESLGAERAKLEVIHASNPHALQEHEKLERDIEKERKHHDYWQRKMADVDGEIKTIRDQWEPRLDELVGQINEAFSHNFEQINCAGEVGVHKDEDFDKWSIQIRVKFRMNEVLQRLDQHRQSGGERAVSTIFYLMSLQSMAQAPFRVVDEINQGMDPRNERMVHERMVEIACREHTSQYFLITPKLLSGLKYDGRMRVHTIVSGEHVHERGTDKMNFAKFASIQRRIMGGLAAC
ncbi:SMC5-like protein [Diplogelasinospora grovesii]|uniref:Structural maintenance of chromosomes protein 5 n=1 Tax=Diplogelasinospora grovesii TaxID=303347 RepID=A0AAN6N397_9PEZI|nr:SMC5-like protein [Diplogelasinospora grovesii]